MNRRWDYLYELKPIPLTEHLVAEAARLVAQDLACWPLAVQEWARPEDAARFARLLAPGAPRPGPAVYAAAFHLARLELMREVEQIDDYMRNERWREVTAPGTGFEALLLISRYLVEQMLAINEATQGRIKRPVLIDLLQRAERHLQAAPLVIAPD